MIARTKSTSKLFTRQVLNKHGACNGSLIELFGSKDRPVRLSKRNVDAALASYPYETAAVLASLAGSKTLQHLVSNLAMSSSVDYDTKFGMYRDIAYHCGALILKRDLR